MCDLLSICGGHPDPWNQTWWYISSDRLSEDILILGTKLDDILVVTDYLSKKFDMDLEEANMTHGM